MDKQEAIKCYGELREWIENMANEIGVEETMREKAEECINVIPESPKFCLVIINDDPVSYRLGNIRFDFKKALVPALELVTAINAPESVFNYVQLLVATALFVGKAIKKEYKKLDAFIIVKLNDMEKKGRVDEEHFVAAVLKDYKSSDGNPVNQKIIYESINRLYETKVVGIENGYISLVETVWGNK